MIGKRNTLSSDISFSGVFTMISIEEWNARIDAFIMEENNKKGRCVPVHRIYCQDDTDRSGGGIYNETVTVDTIGRFARALGEYGATSMVAGYTPGRTATISTTVYQLWRTNNEALAFRWVMINIAISFVVLMAVNLLERRERREVRT